jgi:hypothetical protein
MSINFPGHEINIGAMPNFLIINPEPGRYTRNKKTRFFAEEGGIKGSSSAARLSAQGTRGFASPGSPGFAIIGIFLFFLKTAAILILRETKFKTFV